MFYKRRPISIYSAGCVALYTALSWAAVLVVVVRCQRVYHSFRRALQTGGGNNQREARSKTARRTDRP